MCIYPWISYVIELLMAMICRSSKRKMLNLTLSIKFCSFQVEPITFCCSVHVYCCSQSVGCFICCLIFSPFFSFCHKVHLTQLKLLCILPSRSLIRNLTKAPFGLPYNPHYSTCFFSRNNVFLSQQVSKNSVFQPIQPSFSESNGAKTVLLQNEPLPRYRECSAGINGAL